MISFEDIETEYLRYARKWESKNPRLPVGERPDDFGGHHLEILEGELLALISTDRGHETSRQETKGLDEFLYWIFKLEAYGRGWKYELEHRHPKHDSRRIVFQRALEEIGKLSPKWRDQLEKSQQEILSQNPYRDRGL